MNNDFNAERRVCLRRGATLSLLAAGGVLTACAAGQDRGLQFSTLAAAQDEVMRLTQAPALDSAAAFSWSQTLEHCAQSIEFSMSGFPEPKSALFQKTVGTAAFSVFSWRGKMNHDLAEPIPGAPALASDMPAAAAVERLQKAIATFAQWNGELKPHFAYGELTKPQYEQAHAMHLAQHLSGFTIKT
nr:DUF1569 domain-containing protein [uncultured Rhodoferax sp.]